MRKQKNYVGLDDMMRLKSMISISLVFLGLGCGSGMSTFAKPSSEENTRSQIKVSQAYLVKPDILALKIESGKVIQGQQVPYQSKAGKQRQQRGAGNDWVEEGGRTIGNLVGKQRNVLRTFDRLEGAQFDTQWADRPTSYRLTSSSDRDYSAGVIPTSVFRKSKPTNMAQTDQWKFEFPMAHVLYLQLPAPLKSGETYQVQFPNGNVENLSFRYQPNVTRSEAVHVSHLGFQPNDPVKVAFLSTWMGSGGKVDYPTGLNFSIVNEKTSQVIYNGKTTLSRKSDQPEDPYNRNLTFTNVYLMDFSNLKTSGNYRVCVEQVGCSVPFQIGQNLWRQAFYVSARGLYHQRSGIELGPPYTTFKRPRSFYPKDGVEVFASNLSISQVDQGIGNLEFSKVLGKSKTNDRLSNAWGGYFDAGDWDRRIQHVEVSRLLFELVELFPNYFSKVNLNIPRTNRSVPDIVNESLWGIDFFKRMQTSEGGIRGGIQSETDPRYGEGSWQESTTILAYAPDAWSSYLYTGIAARAANWLKSKDAKLAKDYQNSALRAMAYAERHSADRNRWQVRDARNLAALELYRLTENPKWHQVFLQNTVFKDAKKETAVWDHHDQRDAAFLYARLPERMIDQTIRQNAINALVREADEVVALTDTTAFKWSKNHPYEPVGWHAGLGSPKGTLMLRAHALTRNPKYLRATLLASQFPLGANPDNMSYTTGLGHRYPKNPLVTDQRITGQAPPPGITVYGPFDPIRYGDDWAIALFKDRVFPALNSWPTAESYFDIYLFPMATEFTVQQTIAPSAYIWGYLAASNASSSR